MTERTVSPAATVSTFAALVALTVATVGLSFARMGPAGHLAVGLAFGVLKAGLVVFVFMHLVRSPGRTWLAAGLGLAWLNILVVLTLSDYLTRHEPPTQADGHPTRNGSD